MTPICRPLRLTLALALLWPMASQAGTSPPPPPLLDLTAWVQLRSTDLYGPQWPKAEPGDEQGINPAYVAWHLAVTDPRPLLVKNAFDTATLQWTHGDPPVTELYQAARDVTMTTWVGDDGNLHAYIHYTSETRPTPTDQSFIAMRVVPPGQSAEDLRNALSGLGLPMAISAYQAITLVPEPASALLMWSGIGLLVAGAGRRRGRAPAAPALVAGGG